MKSLSNSKKRAKNSGDRPNIFFIICDALRPDSLHCYGNPNDTSPVIDKLASEGVLFTNVFAHTNHTLPGVVALLAGFNPITKGDDPPWGLERLRRKLKKHKKPFDVLHEDGYVLAATDLIFLDDMGPQIKTSDVNAFFKENKNKNFLLWHRPDLLHLPYKPEPPYDTMFLPKTFKMSQSTKKKLEIVKAAQIIHKPGFVSSTEMGTDLTQDSQEEKPAATLTFCEEDRTPIVALYDGLVKLTDLEIEKYLKELEELGLLDNTIIVLTADHGEQLLERGSLGHSSCCLDGNLHDENIRIPLIIRYPSVIPKGKIIDTQVSQVDVMPTILDILGVPVPDKVDGHSLLPLIEGKRISFKEETYATTPPAGWQALKDDKRRMWCLRLPEWKLIRFSDPQKDVDSYELYNLKDDPQEKLNIIESQPEIVKELKKKLDEWIQKESFDEN